MKWFVLLVLAGLLAFGDVAGVGDTSVVGSYHLDLTSLA